MSSFTRSRFGSLASFASLGIALGLAAGCSSSSSPAESATTTQANTAACGHEWAACRHDEDCCAGNFCLSLSTGDRTCSQLKKEGEHCEAGQDSQCARGLSCKWTAITEIGNWDWSCWSLDNRSEGEPCKADIQCKEGLRCLHDAHYDLPYDLIRLDNFSCMRRGLPNGADCKTGSQCESTCFDSYSFRCAECAVPRGCACDPATQDCDGPDGDGDEDDRCQYTSCAEAPDGVSCGNGRFCNHGSCQG